MLEKGRRRPSNNSRGFGWIHTHHPLAYNIFNIVHLLFSKLIFRYLNEQLVVIQMLKNLPQMLFKLLLCGAIDQKVIKVYSLVLVQHIIED